MAIATCGGPLCRAEPNQSARDEAAATTETKPAPQLHPLRIIPMGDWKASRPDVEKVLYSAAGELWKFFPDRELPPIIVLPQGGPIVLYQRADHGELQVRLNTGGLYWSQYAYQFSHEFCHILCNYDGDPQRNKWFEESICEMASIFSMREMAKAWKQHPPYPNWRDYSSALRSYADDVFAKDKLPDDTKFVDWFEQNRDHFYTHATDRPKNRVVARQLLPLFEQAPDQWPAVGYLNVEKLTEQQTFEDYLAAWHHNSPAKYRPFIRSIAAEFKIQLADRTAE